jgi:hypothetical protein
MGELLFIATIIFVAYVVFVVLGGKKETSHSGKHEEIKPEITHPESVEIVKTQEKAETISVPPPAAVISESNPARAKPAVAKSDEKPVVAKVAKTVKTTTAKSTASKSTSAKTASAVAPASVVATDSIKNPNTGEVAKIPGSYAFAKRWIKDALVEEGLLEKVYKNNELDDEVNAKIQVALQQIKAMPKYQ